GPGPHGERIRAYGASRTDLAVSCVVQEEPLGLGHAVSRAAEAVGKAPSLILLGDTIVRADLRGLVTGGSKVGVREVEDPRRFGVAEIENGRIVSLVEKPEHPKSKLALVGLYYLEDSPLLFSCLEQVERSGKRTKGEIQLTDALAEMLARGADLRPFPVEGWYDCGKTDALLETNRALLDVAGNHVERRGVIILPPVALDPTAEVTHSVIGPHASIGARAKVSRSVIKNSIVNDGAVVEDVLLDLSVIGENALVRGGYHRLNVGDSSEVEVS
ncbi:MAG TPA: sugar phosphate nucleotidyltransferase, partial [Candidatus Eisenbacteria bacterium]|nr:sugar phosphate nucleotidyltransferase [Candidatus Eisenbacteria bacterium]